MKARVLHMPAAKPSFIKRLKALHKNTKRNREAALALLNERHFSIRIGNQHDVCDMKVPDAAVLPQKESEFLKRYRPYTYSLEDGGRRQSLGKLWLNWPDRHSYDGTLVFKPEGAPVDESADNFNTWQGFRLKERPGKWDKFASHLLNVVCRGEQRYYDYLLDYLGHMVQTPGRLPGVAIVLRGGQGTGKTIVYKMLELLFHPFNAVLVEDPDRITGRFNWHLTDKILVCADEALFARDLKSVGPLKSRITAERILFEQKHIDAITLENYIRLIIISNDEHVIHADEDERRYFVLETADTYAQRPGEPESRATARRQPYFDAISKQMKDEGGAEAMMHDLAKRDLSKFDPRVFPDTPFLARQKELSRKPEEQWLWDVVDTQPWFDRDRVRKTTVNDHHESWMKGRKFRHVMNESELGRMLVQMFGLGIVRKLPVVEGGARVPVYCFPPRDEARRILRHEQPEKRAQKFRLRASKPTWSRW